MRILHRGKLPWGTKVAPFYFAICNKFVKQHSIKTAQTDRTNDKIALTFDTNNDQLLYNDVLI